MRCTIYNIIYKWVRLNRIRDVIIRRHMLTCPACRPDSSFTGPVGYTADQVRVPVDLWQRIRRGIREAQSPSPSAGGIWRPVYVAVPASLVVLILLYLVLVPGQPIPQQQPPLMVVKNRDIVIHSVNVGHSPAQTVFFQSKEKDRVIVWVTPGNGSPSH